jgi:hypothetical protein
MGHDRSGVVVAEQEFQMGRKGGNAKSKLTRENQRLFGTDNTAFWLLCRSKSVGALGDPWMLEFFSACRWRGVGCRYCTPM